MTWFGRLLVTGTTDDLEDCHALCRRLGGRIHLVIDIKNVDSSSGLELLNEGAAEIVVDADRFEELAASIPVDRIRVRLSSSDEMKPAMRRLISTGGGFEQDDGNLRDFDSVIVTGIESTKEVSRWHGRGVEGLIGNDQLTASFITEAYSAILASDRRDALWPTVIVDELGIALGLAYSNPASLYEAAKTGRGVYWSRSRNELWEKGKTSGATQELLGIAFDCDADCLRFTVRQNGPGFCHKSTYTCFGEQRTVQSVLTRLRERMSGDDAKSFTKRLAGDPEMLRAKLLEEADELAAATESADVTWEAADLIYFAMIRLLDSGVALDDVYAELAAS